MGWWQDQALPRLTDHLLKGHDVGDVRAQACTGLQGRVLEIGFGSGLNIAFYPAGVTEVHAVEPADVAWELSARRRARTAVPVLREGLDGQTLLADDASYDAALCTFTLCTIPDPVSALTEVRRVLRPGGALHFAEHGLAPDPGVRRWQHRLDPLQQHVGGGCHLTRDVPELLAAAGLEVRQLNSGYLPGPPTSRPWTFTSWGRAER